MNSQLDGRSHRGGQERAGTAEILKDLKGIAFPIQRERGTILFCEGESGGVFLLCQGKARLSMYSRTGHRLAFRTVGPGYLLGLPATVCNKPYNFTAELLEDSQVAFIRNKDIPALLRRHNDLCFRVVQTLGQELIWLQRASSRFANQAGKRARAAAAEKPAKKRAARAG